MVDRDVWKIYLKRALAGDERQFEIALSSCTRVSWLYSSFI